MSTKIESFCKVAVGQMTATNNKERNLGIIKRLIKSAVKHNAKLLFLPEACDYIATDSSEARTLAEPLNGHLVSEYKNLAKDHKLWLSIGGFHEKCDECYDLRFPEQSILQTKLGADILSYPSAFTKPTGEAHWEILLRARAIECQCYVIAAAQYGQHNSKRASFGNSMIIDPWGTVLAACSKYTGDTKEDESVAVAEIDNNYLLKVRQEMPVFQHRRNDIYSLNLIREETKEINDNEIYKFADKIIPGSTVFYHSQYSFAFTNIRCVVPGHVLITSLRVANRLVNLTKEEVADLFQSAIRVQKAVEQEYKASSSTVTVQDGQFAGQTVPHVHVHILPRKQGDFQRNDDVYLQLAKHDRDDNPQPIRSKEEMIEEAGRLRKYFM